MTPQRILHVGALPPPLGGIAVTMQALLKAKALQSFESQVFNISRGTPWEIVGYKSVDLKRAMRRLKLAVQLWLHIRKWHPALVHFHCGSSGPWDFLGDMLMFLAIKLHKIKIVFHWHCNPSLTFFPGRTRATQLIFQMTAGTADALFVLSERYRRILPDLYANKTFVIPNTFDSSLLSIPNPRPIRRFVHVIFIGRLTREKGIWDVIQIASKLVDKASNVRFLVAGQPSPVEGGMDRLQRAIKELDIESNIKFIGSIVEEEKKRFFNEGDIMLSPSHRESFGIAALEGMASGIPVVAYSIGLLPDLIKNGLGGFLADQGDIDGLVSGLYRIVQDPALRERMGEYGREQAKRRYDINIVAEKVRNIYSTLLGYPG